METCWVMANCLHTNAYHDKSKYWRQSSTLHTIAFHWLNWEWFYLWANAENKQLKQEKLGLFIRVIKHIGPTRYFRQHCSGRFLRFGWKMSIERLCWLSYTILFSKTLRQPGHSPSFWLKQTAENPILYTMINCELNQRSMWDTFWKRKQLSVLMCSNISIIYFLFQKVINRYRASCLWFYRSTMPCVIALESSTSLKRRNKQHNSQLCNDIVTS